jgi:type IV pilus assembly protein PilF
MEALKVSRRRGFALAVLGVGLTLAGCAGSDSLQSPEIKRLQARSAYEQGLAAMGKREVPAALAAFQETIALDPSTPVYRNTFGLLYLDLRRPDLALEQFQTAVKLDPEYADAHLYVGVAQAELARWQEAVDAYKKALALPTLTVPHLAHQNLGLALYHLKRYREAETALRFAISLEPTMEGPYYNLGLVYLAEGRREDARAAWQRARDLAPQSPFGQAARQRLKDLGG